jgi:hypothetical protein
MKASRHPFTLAVATTFALHTTAILPAGTPAPGKMTTPMTEVDTFGQLTFGAKFSEHLQSGYVDVLSGLFRSENGALFLNVRGTFGDNNQQQMSIGLGYRHLFEEPGIIVGANVYYDYIDSEFGNSINQLGVGAEILTKWVDARFNYYIPDNDRHLVGTFTTNNGSRGVSAPFTSGTLIQQAVRRTNTTTTFGIFEEGLEGWNAEAGVLIPGVEQYFELRIFAGGYSYNNPAGGDIAGFKARAEARVTEGVTLDLEYWEDEELVGGNWVGGVRVSLPFDIGNLFAGKNPFEGAGEVFRPRKARQLRDRMDEMVIRSHRIMTGTSKPEPMGSTTTTETEVITTGRKVMPPITPTPPPSSGEGSPEGPPSEGPSSEGFGEGPA